MGSRRELEPDVLLGAYADGIFPMADETGEIEWFSPDPRAIIPLDAFRVSSNLGRSCRSGRFEVHINRDFAGVMSACAEREEGTWISRDIIEAYTRIHGLGFGYSVEVYREGELAGGLYGVALGGAFFGESMFHRVTDASKVALVHLVERMRARGFTLLDVQFMTPHLRQFGTIEIPRETYLARLQSALRQRCVFAD
ncbi:MAG: leucyl/phenylalanyl-tRNA--protein transferase [Phycisphaerales bacterium]|nr:leucyl/phenylalanyl-tRNA--protein transferase [Phycisphaerales bacterium]